MRMGPDGKARVQWGAADNADTTTSGAAPGAEQSTGTADAGAGSLTVGKQGYLVRLTNEQLDQVEILPVWMEHTLSPARREEQQALRLAEAKARIAGITARLALAHPALHPVIELHSPDQYECCQGCDAGAYAEDDPDWPCSTINLILEGL